MFNVRCSMFPASTMNDLKFAFRQLLKNPGFTAVAVLTLALGIGANTAIFSVVNAVLLRPLPYTNSDRLVAVCESNPRLGWPQYVTSVGAYVDWRRQNSVFQQLAAGAVLSPSPLFGKTEAELVHVAAVSADFFPLLGIQPILGRQIAFEEENPDRGNVVLLSEGLWRERFGADPITASFSPLPMTSESTFTRCAPKASRTPISRVRCATVKERTP